MKEEFVVYILKSVSNGKRYIGYTSDLNKRLKEHNQGMNTSTRGKGPWQILYSETGFFTRREAANREVELKKMKGGIQLRQLLLNGDTTY